MHVGIGPIEVLILVGVAVVFAMVARGLFGRRTGSVGGDVNLPHPQLKQCPGCGAPITVTADACPQCGLRISA